MKSDEGTSPLPNSKRNPSMRWDAYVYTPDPDALAGDSSDHGAAFSQPLEHMGGKAVPAVIRCGTIPIATAEGAGTMPALSGSASMLSNRVTLTLTNVSVDTAVATQIRLKSGDIVEATGSVLTHPQITAGNSFDHPDEVHPADVRVSARGGKLELSVPARSVVSLRLRVS